MFSKIWTKGPMIGEKPWPSKIKKSKDYKKKREKRIFKEKTHFFFFFIITLEPLFSDSNAYFDEYLLVFWKWG